MARIPRLIRWAASGGLVAGLAMAVAYAGHADATKASAPGAAQEAAAGPAMPERIELYSVAQGGKIMAERVIKSDDEWRKELDPEAFRIARHKGTERAFTGKYWNNHEAGVYRCVCCGNDLFTSDTKFDSGTGWPSFSAPVDERNVATETDNSMLMRRTEVMCSRCDAHLGHVFDDGPNPTGMRYCINSAALDFDAKDNDKK